MIRSLPDDLCCSEWPCVAPATQYVYTLLEDLRAWLAELRLDPETTRPAGRRVPYCDAHAPEWAEPFVRPVVLRRRVLVVEGQADDILTRLWDTRNAAPAWGRPAESLLLWDFDGGGVPEGGAPFWLVLEFAEAPPARRFPTSTGWWVHNPYELADWSALESSLPVR